MADKKLLLDKLRGNLRQVASHVPDVITEKAIKEESLYDLQSKKESLREQRLNNIALKGLIDLRKDYAVKVFWLTICWSVFTAGVVILEGFNVAGFSLSNTAISTLLGTSLGNVLLLVGLVIKSIFPK